MGIKRDNQGAVSVFLIIILVPCIVISSIFVDISRVRLSKSMAISAGDLALNTLMTNYDADLSEWYGMAVSCQNIEEFYAGSAQFFLRTISSRGLSDDEIKTVADYYAAATGDDTIYDLLQVETLTAPSDMIKPVEGANLTSATMLKDQIVEFMKYRAPIELTVSLIDRWKNDSSLGEALEGKKNETLVNDKQAYFEKEGELLSAAYNSYCATYDYYIAANDGSLSNELLKQYADNLTLYKNAYEDMHMLYVSYLSNTNGLTIYNRVAYALDTYNDSYTEKSKEIYSYIATKDDVAFYFINGDRIISLLENLENIIKDFKETKLAYEQAAFSLMDKMPGTGSEQPNAIQWWVRMNQAVNASGGHTAKLDKASKAMLEAYSKVLAIKKCELGKNIPEGWEAVFDALTKEVQDLQAKYLVAGVSDSEDVYLKIVNQFETVSKDNINKISADKLEISLDGTKMTVKDAISYINSKLTTIRAELQNYINLLTTVIDGDKEKDVKKLDDLIQLATEYNEALDKWTDTAEKTDTDLGKKDCEYIAGKATGDDAKNNITQEAKEITGSKVESLKTRLINIRGQLKTLSEAIDSLKYGGKKLADIKDYETFSKAAKGKVKSGSIGFTNKEIEDYAKNTLATLIAPNKSVVIELDNLENNSYNPKIDPITQNVETPEFFVYMYEKYGKPEKESVDEEKKKMGEGEEKGNKEADNAKNKGRYHGGGTEITKDFSKEGTFNILEDLLSGIADIFSDIINLDFAGTRDDLYVTAYAMNMLSYATYEEEGIYNCIKKEDSNKVKELTLPKGAGKYRPEEYEKYIGTSDAPGPWLSENLQDDYNKSLTNKLINKSNNAAYAAEIEYILYGGRSDSTNDANVKAVYSDIYGIRYVLNLVSGFKNFWSAATTTGKVLNSVAGLIQMATCGIIPAPLTKVILIPILTIFETSKDLDRLEAGFPVEIFKTGEEQWWIALAPDLEDKKFSVSEFLSSFGKGKTNTDSGIFYSDYLTVFLYLGLKGKNGEAMYQRMGEVIQANMRKITGKTDYSLNKSIIYFQFSSKLRVKPLLGTLPIFTNYGYNMEESTDWCVYDVNTIRGY